MLPTLKPEQLAVSFNWYPLKKLKVSDLIVIKVNERFMIKRIQKVNKQGFFVIGDNRSGSTDSRQFGWVDKDQIIGKVIYVYFCDDKPTNSSP